MKKELEKMIKLAKKEMKGHPDFSLSDKSYIEGKIRGFEICLILLQTK